MTTAEKVLEHTGMFTKEEMLEVIEPTEGIEERLFEMAQGVVKFSFDPETEDPPKVILSGDVLELTSESYMNACQIIGLGKSYSSRTPIDLIVPHLNYWFPTLGGQKKALIKDRKVVAFIRAGTEIYSTKKIVETICTKLNSLGYKEIFFDKIHHDLHETQFSVVVGDKTKDVGNEETIHGGLQFQNSILGYKPLVISSYINHTVSDANGGMISVLTSSQWDRRLGSTAEEIAEFLDKDPDLDVDEVYSVYDWVDQTTVDVEQRLDKEFGTVARLKTIAVGSHAGTFFNDIYRKYKIPVVLRKALQEEYADRDGNSVYDLWAAMVAVTGRHEVRGNPAAMRHMMLVAGEIAAHPDRCNECHRLMDIE